ncbi:DUF7529 family protein [Halomarina rubra]|uniref:Uncharacterized protein n=1 Tax=Halomarina rubra TaxID=2071873 RepID=A0ABD6ATU0_9EURY|nr:hypothetical protein [Halomarina rubra]
MPEIGEETDYADRVASNADALKNAWNATREELYGMAEELEEKGWDALAVAADDLAPESPEQEPTGRYGLTFGVVDNLADDVLEVLATVTDHTVEELAAQEEGEPLELDAFDRFEVFQHEQSGQVYMVVAYFDDDSQTALLLAGAYQQMYAGAVRRAVVDNETAFVHVQRLDRTPVASFRHEEWEPFFPKAEQRLAEGADEDPRH